MRLSSGRTVRYTLSMTFVGVPWELVSCCHELFSCHSHKSAHARHTHYLSETHTHTISSKLIHKCPHVLIYKQNHKYADTSTHER